MSLAQNTTLLHQCADNIEANLLLVKLNNEDILATISNANTATMIQVNTVTYDIYVPSHQLTKSRVILQEFQKNNHIHTSEDSYSIARILMILVIVILLGIAIATGMTYY